MQTMHDRTWLLIQEMKKQYGCMKGFHKEPLHWEWKNKDAIITVDGELCVNDNWQQMLKDQNKRKRKK